ncbi:MAG: glycosyltransferase family 4 protein [Candidatus Acidiferrales bacterium]
MHKSKIPEPRTILIVEPLGLFPSHFEGLAIRISSELANRGHKVTLLTYAGLRTKPSPDTLPFKLDTARKSANSSPIVNALPGDPGYFRLRFRPFLSTFRAAFGMTRRTNVDCAYFLDWHPILLLLSFNLFGHKLKSGKSRFFATLHTPDKLKQTKSGLREHYRRFNLACLRRLITKRLDGTVVLDRSLKAEVVSGLNLDAVEAERIHVVPHGIEIILNRPSRAEARVRLGWRADEKIFLIFGTLRWEKRPDVAIRGIAGLADCRLVIAGLPGQWSEGGLRKIARDSGCEASLTLLLNFVDEVQMRDLFAAADAILMPYAKSFKGASGVLAQACSHGRAVIVSDVDAFHSHVQESGIGIEFEADSPEALRGAVTRFLLLSDEERREMETRAELRAARDSWDSHCEKLEKVLFTH